MNSVPGRGVPGGPGGTLPSIRTIQTDSSVQITITNKQYVYTIHT